MTSNKKIFNKVSIVGFGRFGKTLYRLIRNDFNIVLYDTTNDSYDNVKISRDTIIAKNVNEVYKSDVIFYAVPISKFEDVLKSHQKFIKDKHLLIDVLSVKLHPRAIFQKYLKGSKAH